MPRRQLSPVEIRSFLKNGWHAFPISACPLERRPVPQRWRSRHQDIFRWSGPQSSPKRNTQEEFRPRARYSASMISMIPLQSIHRPEEAWRRSCCQNIYPEFKRLRSLGPVFDGEIRAHFGLGGDLTMGASAPCRRARLRLSEGVLFKPELYSNRIYSNNIGVFFGDP